MRCSRGWGDHHYDGECGDGILPCVDLFTSHSVHVVILLAVFMRDTVAHHLSHMRADYCTDWHDVTLLAVYQSLATSIRTIVKALPRACAMPVCRPEVAGGLGRAVSYRVAMRDDPTTGRTDVGRKWQRVRRFTSQGKRNSKLDMSQGL